jgi:hypothetical protein
MFERYTEKARRVVFFARYEASHYGSPVIGTEHLLLGLVREENLLCSRWVPKAQPDSIRGRIESWTTSQKPTSTAIDLPLSESGKHVLAHAKTEAERLNSKHIGTEHLLLALLQEDDQVSKLLCELGANIATLRKRFEREAERAAETQSTESSLTDHLRSDRVRSTAGETVQIHGMWWNSDYIRDGVQRCRKHNWHWRKLPWKPLDLIVHRKTGKISLDLALGAESTNYEIIKQGWKKDHCAVCGWELCESEDLHGTGYTNGRDWICLECHEKFWDRPDFVSGSYSDIT